jgi:hypothetical protein
VKGKTDGSIFLNAVGKKETLRLAVVRSGNAADIRPLTTGLRDTILEGLQPGVHCPNPGTAGIFF